MGTTKNIAATFLFIILSYANAFAQKPPINDECSQAIEIVIPSNGLALGTFASEPADLTYASQNLQERFTENHSDIGLISKSVWYKFSIPTRRSVSIELMQKDSAIAQNAVGFAVYKSLYCFPNPYNESEEFPILTKFGSAKTACLYPGDYLIQVAANSHANDSIWINLSLDQPIINELYDKSTKPFAPSILPTSYNYINQTIKLGCLSVEEDEPLHNADSFNQSYWVVFQATEQTQQFQLSIQNKLLQLGSDSFYFDFYKGDVRNGFDQLEHLHHSKNNKYLQFSQYCNQISTTTYSLQLTHHTTTVAEANIDLSVYNIPKIDSAATNKDNIGIDHIFKITTPGTYISRGYLTCKSSITDNKCNPNDSDIVLNEWLFYNGDTFNTIVDTFNHQLLTLIHISNPSKIEFDENQSYPRDQLSKIYKGDIRSKCDLSLHTSPCLEPGWYTIKTYNKESYSLYSKSFGSGISTYFKIYDQVNQSASKYSSLATANQFLLTDSFENNTQTDYNNGLKQELTIAGKKYIGSFNFHSIKIKYTGVFKFEGILSQFAESRNDIELYIFKGNAKNGSHALDTIAGYTKPFSNNELSLKCVELEAGSWYTIMVKYPIKTCFIEKESVFIRITQLWPKFNYPTNAYQFNKGNAIDPDKASTEPILYAPQTSIYCGRPHSQYYNDCFQSDYTISQPVYYTFSISKKASIQINLNTSPYTNSSIQLYKLDSYTADPTLFTKDNLIYPCTYSNYCALEPGTYTVVAMVYIRTNETSNNNFITSLSLTVDALQKSPNTFAQRAHNFDDLSTTTQRKSISKVSCLSTELINKMNVVKNQFVSNNKTTLWYTFTTSAAGNLAISTNKIMPRSGTNSPKSDFYIYEADDDQAIDFNTLQQNGLVDSTEAQGLQLIVEDLYEPYHNIEIEIANCKPKRYYIKLTTYSALSYDQLLDLKFLSDPKVDHTGNTCEDAKLNSISKMGINSTSINVNCHNLGTELGEDGSNIGCLDSITGMKSSWFKIKTTTNEKIDLSVSLNNKTQVKNNQIAYRFYYGSCQSLTPSICNESSNSSFTLNCMEDGDYYIQIFSPKEAIGKIELITKAVKTQNENCKGFDPKSIIANFEASGGCLLDQLITKNLSSQGEEINYKWYLDGIFYSNDISPNWNIIVTNAIDSHIISLVATNTKTLYSDSVWKEIYMLKDKFTVQTSADTNLLCTGRTQVSAQSSYPEVKYTWYPLQNFVNPYIQKPILTSGAKVWVKATMANCNAFDTMNVTPDKDLYVTQKIEGCKYKLVAPYGVDKYIWNTGDTTRIIFADTSGKYSLTIIDGDCKQTIDFDVVNPPLNKVSIVHDSSSLCLGDTLFLNLNQNNYLPDFEWHDGDKSIFKIVNDTGLYWVRTYHHFSSSECLSYDSLYIKSLNPFDFQLDDTINLCIDDTFTAIGTNSEIKHLWSNNSTDSFVNLNKPGQYWLQLNKGNCEYIDTFEIQNVAAKSNFLPDDIKTCQPIDVNLSSTIDATKYLWLPTNETTKEINIQNTGQFYLRIWDEYCSYMDSITITDTCSYGIYVANSFSPNGDGVNDFFEIKGENISYFDLQIYNRWGENIFNSDDINNSWDGTFKGIPSPVDVYIYILRYKLNSSPSYWGYKSGKIILIK